MPLEIMYRSTLASAAFCCASACAQASFDGYHSFYSRLPNTVFKHESKLVFGNMKAGTILWRGHRLNMATASVFPGVTAHPDDLGPRPLIYETATWACIEGQASTGAGTAARHVSVYVIDGRKPGPAMLFKLPTLFSSCINVRVDPGGHFLFDQATYRYSADSDLPIGLTLSEYLIQGRRFVSTGRKTLVEFAGPDDVWTFRVWPAP